MQSIRSFDDQYPVRTLISDSADWQSNRNWRDADRRKTVLQDYLSLSLKQEIGRASCRERV